MADAINVKDLRVTIGATEILRDISVTVTAGSITALLGPSGAGKTTLMRAIVGLQKPTKGSVTVLDKPAGTHSLKNGIGYMTQNLSVYPDLTVQENLQYFAGIIGAGQADIANVIDRLSLHGLENHLVSNVSGGQKTRVSLGAALLGKPELLVLDEPTVGIDPLLRAEIWGFLHEIAANGTTLVVSSHVMDEAAHCTNLVLLRDGQVLATGSPAVLKEQTKQPDIEAVFLHLVRQQS